MNAILVMLLSHINHDQMNRQISTNKAQKVLFFKLNQTETVTRNDYIPNNSKFDTGKG